MKPFITIACVLIAGTVFSKEAVRPKPHAPVHVISKKRDTFYFRVHHQMLGGQIKVISENGDTVATAPLTRKHALVDFFYEDPGRYTIIICKGDVSQSFDFVKKSASPYVLVERERLSILQ
jgi:hypothetical protein